MESRVEQWSHEWSERDAVGLWNGVEDPAVVVAPVPAYRNIALASLYTERMVGRRRLHRNGERDAERRYGKQPTQSAL